ncbi:MAG TPA: hypothetical protein VF103_15255, partial [Polyangiaceae bacterium]
AQLDTRSDAREAVRQRIVKLLEGVEKDNTASDVAAAIFSGGLSLLFGGGGGSDLAAAKEAANRELEFSDSEFGEIERRLQQAMSALELSTQKYVEGLRQKVNHQVAVSQLKLHVKQNILPYMQAIWSHEPPDQRFFRLYKLPIEWCELDPTAAPRVEPVEPPAPEAPPRVGDFIPFLLEPGTERRFRFVSEPAFRRSSTTRPLVEVADLDTLLGFKGNYMIFPLKESNVLVEYMLSAYRKDAVLGVLDPDDLGNATSDELMELLACLDHEDLEPEAKERLQRAVCERLTTGRADVETVIVPSGQLFIEALPGAHPVLEDFKLLHRAIDVKKAEAEVRAAEVENLRRLRRVVRAELGDADIDRNVVVNAPTGTGIVVETG